MCVLLANELKGKSGKLRKEEYAELFPSFSWLVRDFSLELKDENGQPITDKQYLERAFKDSDDLTEKVELNRIRSVLRNFFQDRVCFTFEQPVKSNKLLKGLDNLEWKDLSPEFRFKAEESYRHFMSKTKPLGLYGQVFDGSLLADYILNLVEQINGGALPNIENTYTYICRTRSNQAKSDAVKLFQQTF